MLLQNVELYRVSGFTILQIFSEIGFTTKILLPIKDRHSGRMINTKALVVLDLAECKMFHLL